MQVIRFLLVIVVGNGIATDNHQHFAPPQDTSGSHQKASQSVAYQNQDGKLSNAPFLYPLVTHKILQLQMGVASSMTMVLTLMMALVLTLLLRI